MTHIPTKTGIFLDWFVLDILVLAIALQQYISVSRDLKRSKAREESAAERPAPAPNLSDLPSPGGINPPA
jgi:hypothetical protein